MSSFHPSRTLTNGGNAKKRRPAGDFADRLVAGWGWGSVRLDVDAGGDCFELADALLEVGQFDPTACRGQLGVSDLARELKPLVVEPGLPAPESGDAGQADRQEHADADHANR